ncbi:MCE family protein [Nocardia camponoti]|uniref:Mce family protein n=1 Tax=Nocardia camponoti TaxID=1616106 RepID=A0A917QK15_9NOCA|nr:MCE family protein [Nocardia camponoti]GGK54295.1 putative Mce family protein [Nocardia camponoti]
MIMKKALMTAVAVSTVAITTGCGFTVEDLPLPKPGTGGDTYTIHAVFENALNLPDQAKVKIGGSDVGVVSSIKTKNYQAVVDLEIKTDIQLPKGSTAELRQATPLGDVFIALSKPKNDAGMPTLKAGDTLSLEQTSAGATVEELLISVSMLFNGGGVASLSRLGTELGSILNGQGGNLAHLITEMTGVIGELNNNSGRIDAVLAEFNTLTNTVDRNKVQLGQMADTLPQAIGAVAENNKAIGELLTKLSTATAAIGDYSNTTGDQLASLLQNLSNLMGAISASGDSFGYAMEQLHAIRPGVNATFRGKSLAPYATLTNLDASVITDPNHGKLWDLRDMNDFVGSFIQVLQIVQGRVGGHR